jgi:hypothetical protein
MITTSSRRPRRPSNVAFSEMQPARVTLPARKLPFQPSPGDLDRHPTAELDACRHRPQPCCNLLATARIDNGRADHEEAEMAKIINCECGYVARGDTDDEVVADLEAHMRRDHPELAGKY